MSRTKSSLLNFLCAMIGQGFGLIVSFISRIFFIKILGSEYLGLNGLFTNILTVLSLTELGVGNAINYSLYKPLANHDKIKCKMLMNLYQKIYIIIGIIILFLGILITPFLSLFIKDIPNINNINLIYILFVINTAISYFFSYKRNLIIADQNRYIATIYRYGMYVLLNIVQIIYLIITKNYIGFLIIQILATLMENILVSKKANQMYPYLKEKTKIPLDNETKNEIIKNTKAMMMHKIGGVVVNSTDNIILSRFVGLVSVGLYSNYYLIINALNLILGQVFSSLTASIGNLCANSERTKQYDIFKKINFLTFWISCFSTISLFCLFNPFITIWIGSKYLFSFEIVLILVINFYITIMRQSVLTFREAAGLFYKDRYKALLEAFINIIASIILVTKFGAFGVFLGTFISSITTCLWVEPYILYKFGFHQKVSNYFKIYLKQIVLTFIITIITYIFCSFININIYLSFFIKCLICLILPNLILYVIYKDSEEFKYFYDKIFTKIINILKRGIKYE